MVETTSSAAQQILGTEPEVGFDWASITIASPMTPAAGTTEMSERS